MQEKVELIKTNGETLSVDLVSEFDCNVNGTTKRYVLLTANEVDQNGLIKIFASNIVDNKLLKIESEEEWTIVKNVMRSIISSSKGDFVYTNTSDNMSYQIDDNYARVIAVQDSAKQALINDYNDNKPHDPEDINNPRVTVSPNAAIYPTESEAMPIGSEVVPGIAEMPQDTIETNEEVAAPTEEVAATPEIPALKAEVSGDSDRDELINSIIAAVDKYIASKSTENSSEVQEKITKMQEELKKMTESLNA